MLWQLVAKITLKACLPLIAVAGVLSYGVYLRGGDPSALWKNAADSTLGRADSLFSKARDDTARAVTSLSTSAVARAGTSAGTASTGTLIFTWRDDNGVTHYSNSAPEDRAASKLIVDPDVNVLAPVSTSVRQVVRANRPRDAGAEPEAAEAEFGGALPGIAGQIPAPQSGKVGSGLDRSQLIRLLQSQP